MTERFRVEDDGQAGTPESRPDLEFRTSGQTAIGAAICGMKTSEMREEGH